MIRPEAKPLLSRWIYVLVKVGEEYLTPFTTDGLERIYRNGGYGDSFRIFLDRVLEALAAPEWPAGTYFPGGWYRALDAAREPPEGVEITPERFRSFFMEEVRVDPEGAWFVGRKRIEGRVLGYFLRNLHFDPDLERYLIRYWLDTYFETRYLHHQSPPFRVLRCSEDAGGFLLHLNDESEEPLRPETLRMDAAERLYCAVKPEGLPARFADPARWQLLQQVEEAAPGWVLRLGAREVPLALEGPLVFPGGLGAPAQQPSAAEPPP